MLMLVVSTDSDCSIREDSALHTVQIPLTSSKKTALGIKLNKSPTKIETGSILRSVLTEGQRRHPVYRHRNRSNV